MSYDKIKEIVNECPERITEEDAEAICDALDLLELFEDDWGIPSDEIDRNRIEKGRELLQIFESLAVPWGDIPTNYASVLYGIPYISVTPERRDSARLRLHTIVYG